MNISQNENDIRQIIARRENLNENDYACAMKPFWKCESLLGISRIRWKRRDQLLKRSKKTL